MPSFPIIDTHVHLYDPAWLRYGWMDRVPALNRPFGLGDLDRARDGVQMEKLVFVEVNADRGLHLAEAAWVQGLAAADPRIGAIVANAPVERGDRVEADLVRLREHDRLRGIRRLVQHEPDPGIMLEPDFLAGVRQVGRQGLVFDLCIKHWQMGFAIELVRRCPDVTFVLDHIGKPGIRHGFFEPWAAQLRELGRLPNIICKLSGVVTEADHVLWTRDQLRPYIAHVLECFGFERVMFGSDWPVSEQTHAYPEWVAIVEESIAGCSETEMRRLFHDNAARTYRL